MKLINKISRYFLLSSIMIFIIVSAGLYFVVERAISEETDEQLINIMNKAVQEIKNGNAVNFPPFIEISSASQTDATRDEFKDILINSKEENDGEPFRQLTSFVDVNGNEFKVVARISLIEKVDMLFSILLVSITAFFLFVLVMYFINKAGSKKILKDFYNTLRKLENFSLKNNERLSFNKTEIEEFENLNQSLLFLADKAISEYRSLKEFTEELNHEIQTPIAVIKSKLELLLQSNNLGEENLSVLDTTLKNLGKLERINKSILLLNKLEHKDLFVSTEINLAAEIRNVISTYTDFITPKNLSVNLSLDDNVILSMNLSLLNILFGNLISNAIKHNIQSGLINIELKNDGVVITNTGLKPKGDTEKFFTRFYKESESSESVGLGLAIVKKICDLYLIEIKNDFANNLHQIKLNFNKTIKSTK